MSDEPTPTAKPPMWALVLMAALSVGGGAGGARWFGNGDDQQLGRDVAALEVRVDAVERAPAAIEGRLNARLDRLGDRLEDINQQLRTLNQTVAAGQGRQERPRAP